MPLAVFVINEIKSSRIASSKWGARQLYFLKKIYAGMQHVFFVFEKASSLIQQSQYLPNQRF